jgi:serine/threonine protein kinase
VESYNDTLRQGDHVGCYQIEQLLGRGGFAATYLAHDLHLDLQVALKEYLPRDIVRRDTNLNVVPASDDFVDDYDAGLKSFAREAKTLARFKHPNIVRVHNVLHKYHTAYMVMDYERGSEMAQLLDERRTLSESELLDIVAPVLDGLEEIHRHGYLHRDIKPSNIYLREQGPPVLLDFGAARFAMSEATQQLTAVVTVGYTPIEQYNISQEDQGPWSDIYALAAVLYEAVTGEMPVDSITRATALQVKRDTDPLLTTHRSAVQPCSGRFLDAIDWALQFKAEDRPQSVAQWRAAIFGRPATAAAQSAPRETVQNTHSTRPYPEPRVTPRPDSGPQINFADLDGDFDDTDMPVLEALALDQQPPAPQPLPEARPRPQTRPQSRTQQRPPTQQPLPQRERADAPERRNTQEVRDVVRRDIMGRTHHDPLPEPLDLTSDPDFTDIEDARHQVRAPAASPAAPDSPPPLDARSFAADEIDERDWDIPQPSRLAAVRWIFPLVALTSIIAGALYFVNQPTNRSQPVPATDTALDIDNALATARTLEATGNGVFPIDYSSLDYYREILRQEPDNASAKAGINRIERNLMDAIDAGVEANELARVNRLLARAKSAGLDVSASRPKSASEDSDFVRDRIVTIRQHLSDGDTAAAERLFARTRGNIADIATIDQLEAEIAASQSAQASRPGRTDALSSGVGEQPASLTPDTTPAAPAPQPVASSQPNALSSEPSSTEEPVVVDTTPPPSGSTIASGALGRHLDRLRRAIESRQINSVLETSDVSADREKFVRQMFDRYDYLSVTINQVQQSNSAVSAKLNIAMYNQRRDGSYYSAGRWNGVTLQTSRNASGNWNSIRW